MKFTIIFDCYSFILIKNSKDLLSTLDIESTILISKA